MKIKCNWPEYWSEDTKKKATEEIERHIDSALETIYAKYESHNDPISEIENEDKKKLITLFKEGADNDH